MPVENRAGSERTLGLLILAEIAIFAFTGPNFFSAANAFEVVRLGVELGLLSLALTPIIVTGGIDLSVGSMMGLCAVIFGYLTRDWRLGTGAAAILTLLAGIAGGALNAVAITRFGGAPLIVTGFSIDPAGIGGQAKNLTVSVAGAAAMHQGASEPGTVFSIVPGTAPEQLSTTNPSVVGSFAANADNYVGLDLVR